MEALIKWRNMFLLRMDKSNNDKLEHIAPESLRCDQVA